MWFVCQAGLTPLHIATLYRHDIIVSDLLEAEADVDVQNAKGHTALMLACHKGFDDIVRILLEYDADVDITDNNGQSAIFLFIIILKHDGQKTLRELKSLTLHHSYSNYMVKGK